MKSVIMATTFDVFADFNDTGDQPAAGFPFTYGTETALTLGSRSSPFLGIRTPQALPMKARMAAPWTIGTSVTNWLDPLSEWSPPGAL
jgi:hypothetical protein